MTVLLPSPRFRWVCGTCGGPRVPGAPGKNAALARARSAQAAAFGWGAGSIALALSGAFTSGLAALLWTAASHGIGVVIGVLGAAFLIASWRTSSRAGARRREADAAVKDGWRDGARAILAARGGALTAAQLAEEMRIEPAEADELLTQLAAREEAGLDIDDGRVKYRIDPPPETAIFPPDHDDRNIDAGDEDERATAGEDEDAKDEDAKGKRA